MQLTLPEDIENRLDILSLGNGHTRQYFVMEALLEYLEDVEQRQQQMELSGNVTQKSKSSGL